MKNQAQKPSQHNICLGAKFGNLTTQKNSIWRKEISEITIFKQYVQAGAQNIAGFLLLKTFLSDFVAEFG